MKLRTPMIIGILLLLSSMPVGHAQSGDINVNALFTTENSSVVALNITDSTGSGVAFVDYTSGELTEESVGIYQNDAVSAENQIPGNIVKPIERVVKSSSQGYLQFLVLDEDSFVKYTLYENGVLGDIEYNDIEVTGAVQTDDIAIAVACYFPANDSTMILTYSQISNDLFDSEMYDFKINLTDTTYIEALKIIEVPTEEDFSNYFQFDIDGFVHIIDDNHDFFLIDAFDNKLVAYDKTSSGIDLFVAQFENSVTNYEVSLTNTELSDVIVVSEDASLPLPLLPSIGAIAIIAIALRRRY